MRDQGDAGYPVGCGTGGRGVAGTYAVGGGGVPGGRTDTTVEVALLVGVRVAAAAAVAGAVDVARASFRVGVAVKAGPFGFPAWAALGVGETIGVLIGTSPAGGGTDGVGEPAGTEALEVVGAAAFVAAVAAGLTNVTVGFARVGKTPVPFVAAGVGAPAWISTGGASVGVGGVSPPEVQATIRKASGTRSARRGKPVKTVTWNSRPAR